MELLLRPTLLLSTGCARKRKNKKSNSCNLPLLALKLRLFGRLRESREASERARQRAKARQEFRCGDIDQMQPGWYNAKLLAGAANINAEMLAGKVDTIVKILARTANTNAAEKRALNYGRGFGGGERGTLQETSAGLRLHSPLVLSFVSFVWILIYVDRWRDGRIFNSTCSKQSKPWSHVSCLTPLFDFYNKSRQMFKLCLVLRFGTSAEAKTNMNAWINKELYGPK